MGKIKITHLLLFLISVNFSMPELKATTTSEIYITCSVAPFGGYTLKGTITNNATQPGINEIGYIEVSGGCNEPYPWVLVVYTDNKNYQGTSGSIHQEKIPSGLIREGGGSIPLKLQTPNTGEEWVFVSDINEKNRVSYYSSRNVPTPADAPEDEGPAKDAVISGIDPRNAAWVAGPDGILYTDDDNFYGDITIPTPYKIKLAVQLPSADVEKGEKSDPERKLAPHGKYSTRLVFEIICEP